MPKFTTRPRTDHIVVHTTATRPSMDIGVKEVRQWHLQKGWLAEGYHYIIRRDGKVEEGRPRDVIGAHVSGHNSDSIGIAMVGGVTEHDVSIPEDNYTDAQWRSLKGLLETLKRVFPKANILGHRDFPGVAKACPCFDVRSWLKENPLYEGDEDEASEPDTAPVSEPTTTEADKVTDDPCLAEKLIVQLVQVNRTLVVIADALDAIADTTRNTFDPDFAALAKKAEGIKAD